MSQPNLPTAPYHVDVVDHAKDPEALHAVLAMWVRFGAMTEQEAKRRVSEVICVIRHTPTHAVVGVSTAYLSLIPGGTQRVYLYRMFIDPSHRGKTIPHRQPWIAAQTVEALRQRQHNDQTVGVVAILENKRIPDRLMLSSGWSKMPRLWQGNRMFCVSFNKEEIL